MLLTSSSRALFMIMHPKIADLAAAPSGTNPKKSGIDLRFPGSTSMSNEIEALTKPVDAADTRMLASACVLRESPCPFLYTYV